MHQFRCRSKPWKRGMAAWNCKSSSLIVSCALFSHPECCPELTSDLEHSLEDSNVWITSTSIPFLFLFSPHSLHEVNGMGGGVLPCSHTHVDSKAI